MLALVLSLFACAPETDKTSVLDTDIPADTGTEVLRGLVAFGFPLPERTRFNSPALHVDHDPVVQPDTALGRVQCTNYLGEMFPHCYDEHGGTDYPLDGGFTSMDAGSSPIVAALGGTVIAIEDGNYDRCHADLSAGDVSCDGQPMRGNYVKLDHGGGVESWYWHMKSGSVAVSVGETVECGQLLGLVGSSGYSSTPHLHFEVHLDGETVDPYAGPYSQPETWWEQQQTDDAYPAPGCASSYNADSNPSAVGG